MALELAKIYATIVIIVESFHDDRTVRVGNARCAQRPCKLSEGEGTILVAVDAIEDQSDYVVVAGVSHHCHTRSDVFLVLHQLLFAACVSERTTNGLDFELVCCFSARNSGDPGGGEHPHVGRVPGNSRICYE